jgi:hypothetical protein
VPWLRERVRPVRADDPRLRQLVRDLDSSEFAVRAKSARELAGLGGAAEAALRAAVADAPSLEVRLRAEALLAELDPVKAPERLRELRAAEALETAGTPEARALLEELAKGDPAARLTREAKASLERLRR